MVDVVVGAGLLLFVSFFPAPANSFEITIERGGDHMAAGDGTTT